MALGPQLRKARMDRKMTTSQVASATQMKVQMVEAIEREDFSTIAAPIYGKGFIKLFAEQVGLDPAALVNEYMVRFVHKQIAPSLSTSVMPESVYEVPEEEPPEKNVGAETKKAKAAEPGEADADLFTGIVDKKGDRDFGHQKKPSIDFSKMQESLEAVKEKIVKEGIEPCAELWRKGSKDLAAKSRSFLAGIRELGPKLSSVRVKRIKLADCSAKTIAIAVGILLIVIFLVSSIIHNSKAPGDNVETDESLELAMNPPAPYVD